MYIRHLFRYGRIGQYYFFMFGDQNSSLFNKFWLKCVLNSSTSGAWQEIAGIFSLLAIKRFLENFQKRFIVLKS